MWISPFEPALQVMIILDHAVEFFQQLIRFVLIDLVDALGKLTDRKDTFPAGHRMRAHNRMDRGEGASLIQWASPLALFNLLSSAFSCHLYAIGSTCDSQSVYKILVGLR